MPLTLDARDQALLDGTAGPAAACMRVVVRTAESMEAEQLLDITGAHIDSCLYHGQAGLDFAQRLADDGAQVSVPTTLNVSSLDLLHPELYRATTTAGPGAGTDERLRSNGVRADLDMRSLSDGRSAPDR